MWKFLFNKFKGMSPKQKLIVLAIGTVIALFPVIFICVLTSPLWVDSVDFGIGGTTGGSYTLNSNYTSVQKSSSYWWPIGSDDTETKNGVEFASGDPASSVITSEFYYRADPYTGQTSMHTGLDIGPVSRGYGEVNVIAAKAGTVTSAKNDPNCESNGKEEYCNGSGYGNYIIITHDDGNSTVYGHLHKDTIVVSEGQKVSQGQVIAKVGSSGRSTGLHLHFEVRENGSAVDPENYISMDSPRPKSSSGSYIQGSSNKQSVCLSLKDTEFGNNAVAALMTNMNFESGFNPEALGDNDTSYGLCQWHDTRWDNLKTMFPNSYNNIGNQIEFLINELQTSYTSVYNYLNDGNNNAGDMAYYFCVNFEKPANTENTCTNRKNNSGTFTTYVNNGCK